jgi:hypothetical protein
MIPGVDPVAGHHELGGGGDMAAAAVTASTWSRRPGYRRSRDAAQARGSPDPAQPTCGARQLGYCGTYPDMQFRRRNKSYVNWHL